MNKNIDFKGVRQRYPIADYLRSKGYRLNRNGKCCCPFHDEKSPSFSVSKGPDNLDRWKCFVCDIGGDITELVKRMEGLSNEREAALWLDGNNATNPPDRPIEAKVVEVPEFVFPIPKRECPTPGRPFQAYGKNREAYKAKTVPQLVHRYTDREGHIIGITCRLNFPGLTKSGKPNKKVLPFRLVEGLGWMGVGWAFEGETHPIYNLFQLVSNPDLPVLLVEGEKKVDLPREMPGFDGKMVIITWQGGSSAAHKVDWSPLDGRDVIMWPDADETGNKVPEKIRELCKPSRFRILTDLGREVKATHDIVDELEYYASIGKTSVDLAKYIFDHAKDQEAVNIRPQEKRRGVDLVEDDWVPAQHLLVRNSKTGHVVKTSPVNAGLAFEFHPALQGIFAYDTFDRVTLVKGEPLDGIQVMKVQRLLYDEIRLEPSLQLIERLIGDYAMRNRINRFFDDLGGLQWDGKHRLLPELLSDGSKGLLINYANVRVENDYTRWAGARWMIGLLRRLGSSKGIQHDTALVLEGDQGFRKTTFFRTLATILGRDLYTSIGGNIAKNEKDELLKMQGKAIVELAEMTSHRTSDQDAFKAFLDRIVDHYRAPYGRVVEEFPRHCVFGGTTNQLDQYLNDPTGHRRIWPVTVEAPIDAELIARDVEQIWAEAYHYAFEKDERGKYAHQNWLLPHEEEQQKAMTAAREQTHPWYETIERLCRSGEPLPWNVLWEAVDMRSQADRKQSDKKILEGIMRRLGWRYGNASDDRRDMWRPRQRQRLRG
jgi:predicted P-loop ATPase